MIPLEHNGLRAWCDGYRVQNSLAIFFSMFGNVNAVRGIWASLMTDRRKHTPLPVSQYVVHAEGVRYASLRRPCGHQQLHLIMLHPEATTQIAPFAKRFYLVGANPAVQFWPRFNRLCPVPMRAAWRDEIWRLGLEHEKIEELDGIGVLAYTVVADESWAEIVCAAVKEGRLT